MKLWSKGFEPQKLDYVDFLRGFAIFTIVLMHFVQGYEIPGWLMTASSFGGAGVHIFFLCSGFGLYLSHLRRPLGYKSFLQRRFGKIYFPMAVICLIIASYMALRGRDVLMPLLSNLFLYKMFIPEHETYFGGQMWFVSTIIQFYFAWPLLVRLVQWKYGVYAAVAISLGWATFTNVMGLSEERVWNSFFLQYLWEFCLGMKIAEVYVRNNSHLELPKVRILLPVCIVAMIFTGTMGWLGDPWKQYNDFFSLAAYLSLALIIFSFEISWLNGIMMYTNRFSYEWYLSHLLVFDVVTQVLGYFFGELDMIVEIVICLVLSYTFAIFFQWFINRRFGFRPRPLEDKC
ncbi:MAG: acyltransferase [Duncaniella sp.]|nr:acyltransferase [Duncaniella sp.]